MAATHPTCHKGQRPGSYFMECGDVRIYITGTGQRGAKRWLAKPGSLPLDARYFRRVSEAKAWAHDALAEYA